MRIGRVLPFLAFLAFLALPSAVLATDALILGTNIDARDSGLLEYLKPLLHKEAGLELAWAPLGDGPILEQALRCKTDALLVRAPDAELDTLLARGVALERRQVMHAEGKEGDATNPGYSILLINPASCPGTRTKAAHAFADWLVCPATQSHIAEFRLDGRQRFFPDAAPPSR